MIHSRQSKKRALSKNGSKNRHVKFGQRISVVGLGKLGVPLAACLAYRGFQVTGVDLDESKVESINKRIPPVFEPGLKELLQTSQGKLTATDDYDEAIGSSEVTFILVPTPSDEQGGFSVRYVNQACERIGAVLRNKSAYHLVVVTSTVLPGAVENELKPILEEQSGKSCGEEFGLCYNPEFIALGSAIHDLLNPDFVLIGESDQLAGDKLASIYKQLCENEPPVARMNFVNAELAKLSVNTFVTTKITFANMLAKICERLPGAEVDVVTSALGLDSRIGRKYLKGAVGYGGPCFSKGQLGAIVFGASIGFQWPRWPKQRMVQTGKRSRGWRNSLSPNSQWMELWVFWGLLTNQTLTLWRSLRVCCSPRGFQAKVFLFRFSIRQE